MIKNLITQTNKGSQVYKKYLCTLILSLLTALSKPSFANDKIHLKEAQWLHKQSNIITPLTQRPTECIDPKAPAIANIGRIAFESPALLGGQAARMGLSCASCHPSGRNNTHFFLDMVSDSPGTADVTHHFFSSKGGNDTLTASMIPDLADYRQNKIKNRKSELFRKKLIQLIEIEFDGQTAPPTILDGLQSYLINTDIAFCAQDTTKPINLIDDWTHLLNIIDALPLYSDQATNTFLIRAARKRIEQIYLRFKNINDTKINRGLISLSRQLEQSSLRLTKHQSQLKNLIEWKQSAHDNYRLLNAQQAKSTYNPEVIRRLISD